MKKNKMMRIASVLLVAVLMSTCAISGTFAKYVTEAAGSDSARVAKWDVKLEDATMTNTFTFDLFNTVYDSDGTSVEQDVANKLNDGKTVIAPGTKGSFVINLKNDSEVNAKYSINFTATNAGFLKFTVNGTETTGDITDLTDVAFNMGDAPAITVTWEWPYESNDDVTDTNLGMSNPSVEPIVTAVITVTQVD